MKEGRLEGLLLVSSCVVAAEMRQEVGGEPGEMVWGHMVKGLVRRLSVPTSQSLGIADSEVCHGKALPVTAGPVTLEEGASNELGVWKYLLFLCALFGFF